ncbi:unnamed protein product [Candidula unifasciata]|uniref:G-protein coupled receptors family 1 profile domain-containing protein n=1 Tax=Candidula unifasciata TaxID=100452 RepID=A0A8S3ZZK1_9EUPU|nr:unnamed protein product [Candidula unifasciata]
MQNNKDCTNNSSISITTSNSSDDLKVCGSNLAGQLISDNTTYILIIVFQVSFTGVLAVGGIITNTINIVVFFKTGLSDSVNISLFGLAVGDLCSLIFSFWESVCFNPLFHNIGAPVVFTEIEYITGCWPHVCFVRVTSYITAFVTFERCLCIALPLKVKSIVTAGRTKGIIIVIFLIVMITSIPEYYVSRLVYKFYPEKNRTLLGIYFIEDRARFEKVTLILNNVVLQCLAFIAVLVCTVILIVQLNRKAKWRKHAAKVEKSTLGKDKKVIKMISFVSVVFIVSNLPSCLVFVSMTSFPQLHPTGVNRNMFYVVWSVVYVMESINSMVNIFIYINMSSKYSAIFYKMFSCRQVVVSNTARSEHEISYIVSY